MIDHTILAQRVGSPICTTIAVCFLNAVANDAHECAMRAAFASAAGDAHGCTSGDVVPQIPTYERFRTRLRVRPGTQRGGPKRVPGSRRWTSMLVVLAMRRCGRADEW